MDKARQQLPSEQPGAIVFRLSEMEPIGQEELDEAIRATIVNSSRLAFTGYCWNLNTAENMIALAHALVGPNGRDDATLEFDPLIVGPEEFIREVCGV